LSHWGPITRTVEDAALMLNVISKPDARDFTAVPYDNRDYLVGLNSGIRGLKIGYCRDFGMPDMLEKEVGQLIDRGVEKLK